MAIPSFQTLRSHHNAAWKRFTSSSKNLDILSSVSTDRPQSPSVLYVLDSSFNPPTLAHFRIATSALLEKPDLPARLLLLLATQNADKPAKPASFEDRLVMMELFAHDVLSHLKAQQQQKFLQIDIGVTRKPYFVDKAAEIESAAVYPSSLEQVHLTGYDTLIRIFNPKYYPPEHTLQPLAPFLSQHRLRVTMRPSDEWGGQEEQRDFLVNLAQGGRAGEGGRPEWAQRIELVPGSRPEDNPVSSTKAREAIQQDLGRLEGLVPPLVRDFLSRETPYD